MIFQKKYIAIELLLLFVCIPVLLASSILIGVKLGIAVIGFFYLVFIAYKIKVFTTFKLSVKGWQPFFKKMGIIFFVIVVVTTAYVYIKAPNALFFVPLNKPLLFVIILFVYSFFSVWPQEFLYRSFFFKRYQLLFKDKKLLLIFNAIVFSLAHLFLKNTLVLLLTFIGGLLFAWTFLTYKSTTLVTIEHAIYGCWIFAVGMGEMLAFPGMES